MPSIKTGNRPSIPGPVRTAAGVLVIGDEILSGDRSDRHLAHAIEVLQPRGMTVAWSRTESDDLALLTEALRQSRIGNLPVFCFGGIGATPDDRTRQAAAQAFDQELERNREAVKEIEGRFGDEAYPHRIRMADLPRGALLIPNPYNRIPGFTLNDHHFFPGFPEMAWPMLDWVLDAYYPAAGGPESRRSVVIDGVVESDLVELMAVLQERHSTARLFSLPRLGERRSIELGFRGREEAVEPAYRDLLRELQARSLECFETETLSVMTEEKKE